MKIIQNVQTGNYSITELAWDEANKIFMALKKISDLIGNVQYDSEYHRQEAARLKKEYEKIILVFEKEIPKGIAQGLDEDILKFI